jgi:glycerate-2-kinase
VEAASAERALSRALADESLVRLLASASSIHLVVAGKAASEMTAAWFQIAPFNPRTTLVVSTHRSPLLAETIEFHLAGHPLPDARRVQAASRALDVARTVDESDVLLVLLSGGASALLARPIGGVTLDDKQRVVDAMLRGGADIRALNTVRKHLSTIKGGRLAESCRGRTVTLAISDVVGDDLAVIGSGPGVPDPSTWREAWDALNRYVLVERQPEAVRALFAAGVEGRIRETPKPGDEIASRITARVIGSRFDAMAGARAAAEERGYRAIVLESPVTGEARTAAPAWLEAALAARVPGVPTCVISSGETTVQVVGNGRGGRNQEFALALAPALATLGCGVVASAGTDGIDGPTNAAGAVVDATSLERARQLGLDAAAHLDDNDSHAFFAALDDLIVTGPTGTNVGDLQIAMFDPSGHLG